MTFLSRFVIPASLSAAIGCGQSFRVPPSKTDLKAPGTLSISIESPEGKEPVALQWELSVPPAVAITTADITVGKAAEAAGKSLTCAMKTKTQRASRYACILVGGQGPIKNGPIAEVHYHAQWDVKSTPIHVGIENILGASAGVKRISMPNVEAIIEIR